MGLTMLFWAAAGILALLVLAALYFALQRVLKADDDRLEDTSTIYTSGVYSLIRKSPREELQAKEPSLQDTGKALKSNGNSGEGNAQEYLDEWRRISNLSITSIENGDKEGVQTYRYRVPEKCGEICRMFGGDAYVTREQLHKHPELIPPFHLGCGCELVAKEAWSSETGSAGWSPILPVDGKYQTPDWRTVAKLNS